MELDWWTAIKQSLLLSPTGGWKQLHDVESGATVGLCLSMPVVVDYFLVRRASDDHPRGDCRNLGEQSYALYKRGHARDGQVAEADGHLLFTFSVAATMKLLKYSAKIILGKDRQEKFRKVLSAQCSCP